MTKKKIVYQPLYDEFEDTPWISRNRELNKQTFGDYSQVLSDIGSGTSEDVANRLAGKAMQATWNDYNRNYQKAVNQNIARNYGRTGSTASTSGGYATDSLQRQYNDMASRLSSQSVQLANQYLANDLQRANVLGGAFNTSGQTTQAVDKANYDIRQINKDRQWQNDVLKEKNKTDVFRILSEAGASGFKGFTEGMKTGNIWGAIGGAIGGAASGAYNAYADPTGTYGYQDSWNRIMSSGTPVQQNKGNTTYVLGSNQQQQAGQNLGSNVAGQAADNITANLGSGSGGGNMGTWASAIQAYLSDVRFKENIKKIGTKNGFNWYEFNYKKGLGLPEGRQEGVIAQEVEQIMPDAIIENNGIKYVNYAKVLGE